MGGESRYQVKIPSNQINKVNYFCSNSYSTFSITSLDPYFITGFSIFFARLTQEKPKRALPLAKTPISSASALLLNATPTAPLPHCPLASLASPKGCLLPPFGAKVASYWPCLL
jgi:hypothetical protein